MGQWQRVVPRWDVLEGVDQGVTLYVVVALEKISSRYPNSVFNRLHTDFIATS